MVSTIKRPFAVFDIDGTLIRWQLHHAMNDVLAKKNLIDAKSFDHIREARMNWKRRSSTLSFREYEQLLIVLFEKELVGLKVSDFDAAAKEVFDEYKDQIYIYTRDLIRDLKKKNYLVFAISGSPENIISKLVKYYAFDDYAASNYEQKNGKFTGETSVTLGRKAELLSNLVKTHWATFDNSIAVGDSEGDAEMLAMVESPIAFNPSNELLDIAMTKRWKIVVERKNVIYQLTNSKSGYILTL